MITSVKYYNYLLTKTTLMAVKQFLMLSKLFGAALLCSSRAGSDMGLLSGNSIVHRDWGRTIGFVE